MGRWVGGSSSCSPVCNCLFRYCNTILKTNSTFNNNSWRGEVPRGRVSRAAAAPRRSRPCVEPEPARQVLLGRDVVLRLRRGGGLIGGCGGCGDVVSHKIIVLGIFPTTLITKLYYAILIPWQRRAEEGESGRDSLPPSTITFESRPTFDRYS